MKATFIPTKAPENLSEDLNRGSDQSDHSDHALEPEVLAACLARYSRTNEGINSILEKYGNKSPAAIFKFIDYGHASIGGLTGGIAIAIDNVSMLSALKLFELSQMADGQESSTRYIELNQSGVVPPSSLGIKNNELTQMLEKTIELGFQTYSTCLKLLEEKVAKNPSVARIPKGTPERAAQRMLKNYGLDRCRYFLPMAAKTNLALVMSARAWAQTLKELGSLPWQETSQLSNDIRTELSKAAPDLIRHSFPDNASKKQVELKLQKQNIIHNNNKSHILDQLTKNSQCTCQTQVLGATLAPWENDLDFNNEIINSFQAKENRYSSCGEAIKRISVRTNYQAIALAEIRDLNRHRTGFRTFHSLPQGFYIPEEIIELSDENPEVKTLIESFLSSYKQCLALGLETEPEIIDYLYFLGTQVPFEHTQQLDKFIYEIELRTGLGSHYRYAQHLKDASQSLTDVMPILKDYIEIGTAEPE